MDADLRQRSKGRELEREEQDRERGPEERGDPARAWSTGELLSRWRAGDADAGERLCERFHADVERRVRRSSLWAVLRQRYESADLVQDFWIEYLRKPEAFEHRGEGSFASWLATVVHHRLVHLYRQGNARKNGGGEVLDVLGGDLEPRARPLPGRSEQPTPTSAARISELGEVAARLLSPEELLVWDLCDVQGFTSVEVAGSLERSDAGVRGVLHRARKKLAAALEG